MHCCDLILRLTVAEAQVCLVPIFRSHAWKFGVVVVTARRLQVSVVAGLVGTQDSHSSLRTWVALLFCSFQVDPVNVERHLPRAGSKDDPVQYDFTLECSTE